MTITTLAPAPTATEAVPSTADPADLEELRRSVRSLGESLAELPLTNPRWHALGASVSTVADLLRRGPRGTQQQPCTRSWFPRVTHVTVVRMKGPDLRIAFLKALMLGERAAPVDGRLAAHPARRLSSRIVVGVDFEK